MARRRRHLAGPVVIGVLGVVAGLVLGFWQLQRLEWKEGLIAGIEARMKAEPVSLPMRPSAAEHQLLRVALTGLLSRRELHAMSSMKRFGPGFRVIVPMELADGGVLTGRTIMVDLGFVPERLKKLADREDSVRLRKRLPKDRVTGLLLWPNERDSFTPETDFGRNIWFARDVEAMAAHLGTEPVLVVAEIHPDGKWPLPRPPGAGLVNRHLEYVLTWFALAAVWAVMSLVWLRAEMRKARHGGAGAGR